MTRSELAVPSPLATSSPLKYTGLPSYEGLPPIWVLHQIVPYSAQKTETSVNLSYKDKSNKRKCRERSFHKSSQSAGMLSKWWQLKWEINQISWHKEWMCSANIMHDIWRYCSPRYMLSPNQCQISKDLKIWSVLSKKFFAPDSIEKVQESREASACVFVQAGWMK